MRTEFSVFQSGNKLHTLNMHLRPPALTYHISWDTDWMAHLFLQKVTSKKWIDSIHFRYYRALYSISAPDRNGRVSLLKFSMHYRVSSILRKYGPVSVLAIPLSSQPDLLKYFEKWYCGWWRKITSSHQSLTFCHNTWHHRVLSINDFHLTLLRQQEVQTISDDFCH